MTLPINVGTVDKMGIVGTMGDMNKTWAPLPYRLGDKLELRGDTSEKGVIEDIRHEQPAKYGLRLTHGHEAGRLLWMSAWQLGDNYALTNFRKE